MGEVGFSGCQYGHGANVNKYVNTAFSIMCGIVTVGWSMYTLGHFFGYSTGDVSDEVLNRVCNLADVMNEIAFCLGTLASADSRFCLAHEVSNSGLVGSS